MSGRIHKLLLFPSRCSFMMNQTRFIYFFLVSWLFVLGCFSTGDDEVVPKTKQQLFGTLRSPNYPYVYPNFLQRTWHLQVPNGYRVQIKFLHFDLEPSHLCEYDAIELLDGQHILGTFCGKYDTDTERVPGSQPILAPGNILTIKFRSDYSNEEDFTGFVALYTAVDIDECVEFANDEERSCDHFCQNYPGGFFCSCRHGYHLHDNNRTCTVHCNNIIYNGRQGEIFSPEYPHPYPGELHCHVRIVLPEGLHPSIHFEDTFNVENHPEIDGCPFDSLTIRSGGELFGPFCGTHPPKDIQALSNEVDIEFHTDSSGQHNGWAFSYMAKGKACPMPLAPLNGSLFPHQENYFFTDQLIFTCNSGFELVKESGEKVRTLQLECQSSGTWSSLFPTCQPLDCGPPPPLENGRYDGDNSTTFLSSVTYSCNTPYYYLRSQANATQYVCNEMSKWISAEGQKELPSCMPACGRPLRSLHNIQKRIVDGRAADPGAFPWQALILARERPNGEQRFGGGAILTSRWLLTASHLLLPRQKQFGPQKPLPPSGLDVFVGLHEIRKRSEAVRPVVESVHLHMGFNHRSYDNDIALLRLKTPIPFGSTIMPVCLPFGNKPSHVDITVFSTASFVNTTVTTMVPKSSQTKSHPSLNFTSLMNNNILNDHEENDTDYEGPSTQQELSDELSPGDMGVVSGWGSTWATLNSSRITSRTEFLQYVNLPVVNQSTCRAGYRKNGRRSYRLTKNMFCAGYAHGGPDTCLGDSGGAYVTQTTGSDGLPQWVVQGLVSWGWPGECGRKGVFGVYSRVANYISWIKEQIQPFGDVDSLPYNDPS